LQLINVNTQGQLPEESEAQQEYATDTEARIRWPPLEDTRLQHYEVCLLSLSFHFSYSNAIITRSYYAN
jgi:hypothetical protein